MVDPTKYVAGVASRICRDWEFGTIDTSMCIPKAGLRMCEGVPGVFERSIEAAEVTAPCNKYSAHEFTDNGVDMSATCTDGIWVVDTDACEKKSCTPEGVW